MGILERRQRHKTSLRRAILDSALQIVQQEGYQGVTIRRIAEAIEYSAPTIYEFFENKEMLFRELKKEWLQKMLTCIREIHAEEKEAAKALKKIALAYAQYALENGAHYRAVMGGENASTDFVEIHALRTVLKDSIRAIAGNNALEDKVDLFRSYLHGIVSLALAKKIPGGKDRCFNLVKEGTCVLINAWKV